MTKKTMSVDKLKKPPGKESFHKAEERRSKEIRNLPLKDSFEIQSYRLSYLENGDDQLGDLLDYFQSIGIPMGSGKWAIHAKAIIQRFHGEALAANQFMGDINSGTIPKEESEKRMRDSFYYQHEMFKKKNP